MNIWKLLIVLCLCLSLLCVMAGCVDNTIPTLPKTTDPSEPTDPSQPTDPSAPAPTAKPGGSYDFEVDFGDL